MSDNTITTPEQIAELPVGQWVIAADGTKACLFDTHLGFPQRMWGMKDGGGTKGFIRSYLATDRLPTPIHLADIDGDFQCPHSKANECGQCEICGKPGVSDSRPMYFEVFGSFEADHEN